MKETPDIQMLSDMQVDQLSVNTIRTLSMDAVEAARSGHPGMPMGMADAAYVLWSKFLNHNPANPAWFNRDRFILSAGHGSMLLYSLLHLTGYDLSLDELKNFRQLDSITPGHPEYGMTPGVETTTGPLGQGFSTGVGMAMAEAHLAARFNRYSEGLVNHYTYAIVSDGDLMEGITHEAASLAGHLELGKLIYLYDSNNISIDGSTDLAFTEDAGKRFNAYGWHVLHIDGHDRAAVESAIREAQNESSKPSLIICKTTIGFGSPNKQGSADSHGAPLGAEEIRLTKMKLGWDPDKQFHIPGEVHQHFGKATEHGKELEDKWNKKLAQFKSLHREEAQLFERCLSRSLPADWKDILPEFEPDEKGLATRASSGKVINAIARHVPQLLGGSADLTGSNKTDLAGEGIFQSGSYEGRNIHYGVREHAMGAALNGLSLHGGVIPYGGTFLIFSDYCRPAIRIASLSKIPSIFIFTHDSIGLGEDGPTHQPVEHLASLRLIPNTLVLRPADANETARAWKIALEYTGGPVIMALTRQALPTYERADYAPASMTEKGAYTLLDAENGKPDLILMASGSEVELAMKAAVSLGEQGVAVRVVSMPSWELFGRQTKDYRNDVLPPDVKARISVEAGVTFGWERWIGEHGVAIGIDRFGKSAPYSEVYKSLGITTERIIEEARKLI
ncbi:MAG: transketolase [Balneolaceae bacterium]